MGYDFDRFLRYDELVAWLDEQALAYPDLLSVDCYGTSNEGRELLLATLTDAATGAPETKPAHWVDANIHSVEVTGGVAALWLIHRLLTGYGRDETITRALRTRTFYVAPRVNPDGVEWALADAPRYRRSSTRRWPWRDPFDAPGLQPADIDGNGRILQMRLADPDGAWMPSPHDERLLVPVPPDGTGPGVSRYRVLTEGELLAYDGFTIPTPRAPEGLDLNRNFPAGWSTGVTGSGDHPLSEPEIDALVRAIRARPNVCGYNAYHTAAGVLLRPSSVRADAALPPADLWAWRLLGDKGTELTGYRVHSVFEDYTWDRSSPMSGAADDWAYDHLGIYAWTTEFWDVVKHATGQPQHRATWTLGPTADEQLAVLRWADERGHDVFVEWAPFDHPQLGPVEIGGWDDFASWTNPPPGLLRDEVCQHADFAVYQALAAPCLEILHHRVVPLGGQVHRIEVGVANTGFFPTCVTELARKDSLCLPVVADLACGEGVELLDATARRELGQLEGRAHAHFAGANDGTPQRALVSWTVRGESGAATVTVRHERAGRRELPVRW